jgi:hypothetical protein
MLPASVFNRCLRVESKAANDIEAKDQHRARSAGPFGDRPGSHCAMGCDILPGCRQRDKIYRQFSSVLSSARACLVRNDPTPRLLLRLNRFRQLGPLAPRLRVGLRLKSGWPDTRATAAPARTKRQPVCIAFTGRLG